MVDTAEKSGNGFTFFTENMVKTVGKDMFALGTFIYKEMVTNTQEKPKHV